MNYETYKPHPDLELIVNCYWTLEVPKSDTTIKQRIIPDGLLELALILGDDIKRYTTEDEYILQPRSMVLGQTMEPFFIEPTGYVNTFAIRFYPYGFANLVTVPIKELANKETAIVELFGERTSKELEHKIIEAKDVQQRIEIIEDFLFQKLTEPVTIDKLVKSTVDMLISSRGSISINTILNENASQRRTLERKFREVIGISPKQLGKVVRLQAALKILLNDEKENLTYVAHETEYYDQAHFIKDFKEFTGINPKEFLKSENMKLSSLFYK
ncbi:MAG: helix-turn-helix domain-containing protein [Leptospiraceae bacterium]|nr:helix-turn-helix domain-containing protein [Leptospiraceae bacterium]